MFREKKRKKGTYCPLQQIHCKMKGNGLPHEQDKMSCDVLQPWDVIAVDGNIEVVCEGPKLAYMLERISNTKNKDEMK